MASAAIHVAIAKKYLEQHNNLNYEEIIKGTLYPDADSDNDKTHYTDKFRGNDNVSHVRGKVNLYAFLEEHETLNDFEKGWFLHLITDYLFFLECFRAEYLLSKSYQDFCKELYHAYDCVNLYMEEKYNISKEDFKEYPSEYYPGIPYEECILPKEMIDSFIKRVSSIDLEKYILKIKENKQNCVP